MRATDRLLAILDAELTLDDLTALPPAYRRKLAALLRYWWQLAEASKLEPKAGVRGDLRAGRRAD